MAVKKQTAAWECILIYRGLSARNRSAGRVGTGRSERLQWAGPSARLAAMGKCMEWRTSRARRKKAEVEEDNGRERGRPNDPQLHPPSIHIPRSTSLSIHNTPALCTKDCIWTGIGQCISEANPVHLFPPDPPCLWELRSRAGRLQNEFRRRESIVL